MSPYKVKTMMVLTNTFKGEWPCKGDTHIVMNAVDSYSTVPLQWLMENKAYVICSRLDFEEFVHGLINP